MSLPTKDDGRRENVYVHWLVLARHASKAATFFARIRLDVPVHDDDMFSRNLEDLRGRYVAILPDSQKEPIP